MGEIEVAFARGQLMQVVKAGESAEWTLRHKKVTGAQRRELMETIRQAEEAKRILRKDGVNIK